MSVNLIVISGKDFIKFLNYLGFNLIRIKGSHHRLKHKDGRITTVPVHGKDDVPKGLLRKIIRDDLKLSLEEFNELFDEYKK